MSDAAARNPFAPPLARVEESTSARADMVAATRQSRLVGEIIDIGPGLAVSYVPPLLLPRLARFTDADHAMAWFNMLTAAIVVGAIAWIILNVVLLHRFGQTVGKWVTGTRVVRPDGGRVSLGRFVFLRGLVLWGLGLIVDILLPPSHLRLGGWLVTSVDGLFILRGDRRCLHDLVAGTRVVTAESSTHATLAGSRATAQAPPA